LFSSQNSSSSIFSGFFQMRHSAIEKLGQYFGLFNVPKTLAKQTDGNEKNQLRRESQPTFVC
jgi:hypothetical protein